VGSGRDGGLGVQLLFGGLSVAGRYHLLEFVFQHADVRLQVVVHLERIA
jgi:hypothetical protein